MALSSMKLTLLLIMVVLCSSPGASSSPGPVPGFLQTLLEGTPEQLHSGPISRYKVGAPAKAALDALKQCIDGLPAEHVKALADLLKLVRTEA